MTGIDDDDRLTTVPLRHRCDGRNDFGRLRYRRGQRPYVLRETRHICSFEVEHEAIRLAVGWRQDERSLNTCRAGKIEHHPRGARCEQAEAHSLNQADRLATHGIAGQGKTEFGKIND